MALSDSRTGRRPFWRRLGRDHRQSRASPTRYRSPSLHAVLTTPVDRYNNPAAYEGGVRWSSSDPLAQPSPATRLDAAVILRTPGKQTITVEGAGNASLTGRATIILASSSQPTDYVTTVLSTNPTAYFRLQAANDTSQVNGYASAFQPGATLATGGAPICDPNNQSVSLDGNTGLVTTSLNWRDINGPVSVAAWVNQSVPSTSAWVAGFGAVTVPDVGSISPSTIRAIVLLPEPDSPTSPSVSPR